MRHMTPKNKKSRGFYPKRVSLFFAVLLVSFSTTFVFAEVLAKVNQAVIDDQQIEGRIRSYLKQIGHDRLSPLRMASLQKEILKKLIEEELLYQEGLKTDLSVSARELAAGVEKIRKRFASQEAYAEALSKEALSVEDIQNGVSRAILIQKVWQHLSQMDETARANRLRDITKAADIQIFESHLALAVGSE